MANKPRHRRFGNIRKRASGRYQIRYPGPDGRMRAGPETYERKSDAERALALIEAQMISGEWADSDRSKIKLRLLRSILTTAVEEDKILPRNPCRVRGAGTELTPE